MKFIKNLFSALIQSQRHVGRSSAFSFRMMTMDEVLEGRDCLPPVSLARGNFDAKASGWQQERTLCCGKMALVAGEHLKSGVLTGTCPNAVLLLCVRIFMNAACSVTY